MAAKAPSPSASRSAPASAFDPGRSQPSLWRPGLAGATLSIGAGLLLWFSQVLGDWLMFLSYDLPTVLRPAQPAKADAARIIFLDHRSLPRQGERPDTIDRRKYADLLERMTGFGATVVAFDISFPKASSEEEDKAFEDAIRRHGRVALAAVDETPAITATSGYSVIDPLDRLGNAAAAVGLAKVIVEQGAVRRGQSGNEDLPDFAAATARAANLTPSLLPPVPAHDRWIQYYGPPGTISRVSFEDLDAGQDPSFFAGKFVFVGNHPRTADADELKDTFPVPHSRLGYSYAPGVEILAQAFLNLVHNDWLRRWPAAAEVSLLIACGLALGLGFVRLPFRTAFAASLGATVVLAVAAFYLTWTRNQWFCWTLVAGAQIPVALGWGFWVRLKTVSREKKILEDRIATGLGIPAQLASGPGNGAVSTPEPGGVRSATPVIPDYALLRRIGRGAYGDVWLARNVVGMLHAVKIIYRGSFDKAGPFEREFAGIERFMPVSRSHAGFVHILHAGRNDTEGYFYYVMEAADDAGGAAPPDPDRYVPRTLAHDLEDRGRLDPRACLDLARQLASALAELHRHRLIHRDIKPANIIVAGGKAKLADIGLVTGMADTERGVSMVGTAGYLAPEGPGTPQADVYSLGKVLYVALTGQDPELFPEWPTRLEALEQDPLGEALNRIAGRACETDPAERYASADAMLAALAAVGDET